MKPCPFCNAGEDALKITRSDVGHLFWVRCTVCRAEGPAAVWEEEAIGKWDFRHTEDANELFNLWHGDDQ